MSRLILFDFDVGNLIQLLGGVYTHDHIFMTPIVEAVVALRQHAHRLGYPTQDYTRTLHILEHDAPTAAL